MADEADAAAVALRTVIADDSVLLRDGLVRLLTDSGFDVVAAVGDADGLLDAVTEHTPDLCLVDVRMPPTHTDEGLRAAIEIRRRHPDIAVLVLSQYVEERYAGETRAPGLVDSADGVGVDRDADVGGDLGDLHRRHPRVGVLEHVGDRLVGHEVDRLADVGRQVKTRVDLDRDRDR